MATAKTKPNQKDETKNLPATQQGGALAEMPDAEMFAADAGAGREEAGADSYAIPFLVLLQKTSPQVDEATGDYIEGARAGMFLNNVTGQTFDGKTGIEFIPVYFKREYIRWGGREGGNGGFKGVITPEEYARMRQSGELVEVEGGLYFPNSDGTVHPKKNDRVSDHRSHYGLVITEGGEPKPCLLSLTSTQIKKSKLLMSALADVRVKGPSGQMVNPAMWANKVKLTTVGESNEKGSWFGLRTELNGFVSREQYAAGKAFYESVKKGNVEAKYEDNEASGARASQGQDGQGF